FFVIAYGGGYYHPLRGFIRLWELAGWRASLDVPHPTADLLDVLVPARCYSALLSTLAVALACWAGLHLGGPACRLLASALVAAAPLAVRDAHIAKADSAATFAATLILFTLCYRWPGRARRAYAIGAAAGLALSIKYLVGMLPAASLALVTGDR